MRVVVPYSTLYPETRAALEADGIDAEYVYVGVGQDSTYHDLVERLWAEGRGWINVEQDIVPWPGALRQLWDCPCEWGGFAYGLAMGYGAYLGCTKFSDSLVRERPGVVAAVAYLRDDGAPRRYWGRLDTRLKQVLEDQEQLTMHIHWPAVRHLNPSQRVPIFNCPRCGAAVPDERVQQGPPPYPCERCAA